MNFFKAIDFQLSHFVLGEHPLPEAAHLIAYLSAALREGYPSVLVGEQLTPSPYLLKGEGEPLSDEEEQLLLIQLRKGFEQLRNQNVSGVVIENDQIAFELYDTLKKRFQALCQKHLESSPHLTVDPHALRVGIENLCESGTITEEQGRAIHQGCTQSLTTISGGPGTGKTYTAGILLRLFLSLLKGPCKIALTAPTGKAAANLQKSFEKFSSDLKGQEGIQSLTLHSLLRLGRKRECKPIDADLILVDESSMIDTKRMVDLLGSVKKGARLILMGDPHQLPPVEIGGLFAELVKENAHGVLLSKCLRTDLASIVQMAKMALTGQGEGIICHADPEPFLDEALHAYQSPTDAGPAELLSFFNQYRILSPLNKGPWGCETINTRIFSKLFSLRGPCVAPILITKNDRTLNLNNGEVGVLVCQTPGEYRQGDFAYFEGSDGIRQFPAIALPQHTWAFCLSVHKSQGSEFDRVLLLWPDGAEKFGRPGLYTGITRAKKQINLICSSATLHATLRT